MNEKEIRELEYEREIQEQAEYMSRWKLRKEIKKKLRALRKKIKADEASLPQLQIIDKDLAALVDPRTLEALRILEEKGKDVPAPAIPKQGITAEFTPMRVRTFKESYAYDASCADLDMILPEVAAQMGKALLEEEAIKYKVYNDDIIGQRRVDMTITVVVDDRC